MVESSEAETLTGQWVDPPAGEKLVVSYAEEWIGYKRSTFGETTATNTEALLRARVLPEFGDETLKQITAPAIRSWLAAMSDEALAPSTVYNYRRAFAQILDQAIDDGFSSPTCEESQGTCDAATASAVSHH